MSVRNLLRLGLNPRRNGLRCTKLFYSTDSGTSSTSSTSTTNTVKKNENHEHEQEPEQEQEEYYIDTSDITNKWQTLSLESQEDMINYLNVKQEFGWNYLTLDEKRAIWYIAYGNWGPRDPKPLNFPEFIFKIMSSAILFTVVGFSLINYSIDKEKIAELEEIDEINELVKEIK